MDEKQISELLECSVCLERLDQSCKVLPCQHTFCRRCLDEILLTKNELRCPECRAIVTQKVSDLPTNILVVRILEGLKTQGYKAGGDEGWLTINQNNKTGSSPVRQPGPSPRRTRTDARGFHYTQHFRQGQSVAQALYDYESIEKEDLNFKRGDKIQLRRQIDDNWYHGELAGKMGYFPANFVKIIIPLPQVPQCRALFDFDLKDEGEKDCLTFQKDEIITVIRRVDENWLEGRKGDKIGIFPLTFTELNDAARDLVSKKTNLTISSVSASSVPVSASSNSHATESTVSTGSSLSATTLTVMSSSQSSVSSPSVSPESGLVANCEFSTPLMPSPSLSPSSSSGQSSSTVVTSVSTVAADTLMVNSSPSPSEHLLSDTPDPQNKRHSYSSSPSRFSPVLSNSTSQRHSMEVVLDGESYQTPQTVSSLNTSTVETTVLGTTMSSSSVSASAETRSPGLSSLHLVTLAKSQEEDEDTASSSHGGQSDSAQPAAIPSPLYIAMYNYLPQKDDELELQKGDHYLVVEKCQDGWFKGCCVKTGETGVFPGNYVSIIRHTSAFKPVNPNVLNIRAKVPNSAAVASIPTNSLINSTPHQQTVGSFSTSPPQNQGAPPLLPRVPKNTTGQKSRPLPPPTMRSQSNPGTSSRPVLFKHSISEIASTQSPRVASSSSGLSHVTSTSPSLRSHWSSPPSAILHQSMTDNSIVSSTNAGMATSHDSAHSLFGVGKDSKDKKKKKDKEKRGFLKLLKDKKSKQPSADSEVSHFTPVATVDSSTHIRCGSYPSDGSLSIVSGINNSIVAPHRKTSSLDSTPPPPVPAKPRPRPLPRERFWCIAPYPPQTDYELCLELGDIIHVHRKREDGWFKGTQERTGKTGMFPASFVEKCT